MTKIKVTSTLAKQNITNVDLPDGVCLSDIDRVGFSYEQLTVHLKDNCRPTKTIRQPLSEDFGPEVCTDMTWVEVPDKTPDAEGGEVVFLHDIQRRIVLDVLSDLVNMNNGTFRQIMKNVAEKHEVGVDDADDVVMTVMNHVLTKKPE